MDLWDLNISKVTFLTPTFEIPTNPSQRYLRDARLDSDNGVNFGYLDVKKVTPQISKSDPNFELLTPQLLTQTPKKVKNRPLWDNNLGGQKSASERKKNDVFLTKFSIFARTTVIF